MDDRLAATTARVGSSNKVGGERKARTLLEGLRRTATARPWRRSRRRVLSVSEVRVSAKGSGSRGMASTAGGVGGTASQARADVICAPMVRMSLGCLLDGLQETYTCKKCPILLA